VNDVKVNDVNVNSAYVRPPYVAPRISYAAVAVGTTVLVLPASCTVVYDSTVYHHCGDTYYIDSDGAYVAVNPPR